jgi:hypothetical protein
MSGPNLQVASARKRTTRGVFPTVNSTGKRNVAADNPVKNIPDTFQVQGFADIEARATALGLGRLASPQPFVGTDQQSDTVGNKSVQNSTIDRYFATLPGGYIKLCMLVGDPRSAIMAHIAGCCEHPCPPSESTYINYAGYHVLMEGEALLDYTTSQPVLFNTQPVKCVGDWRLKETLVFFAARLDLSAKPTRIVLASTKKRVRCVRLSRQDLKRGANAGGILALGYSHVEMLLSPKIRRSN